MLQPIWQQLTTPAASIKEWRHQRQARQLSALLLLLILLTLLLASVNAQDRMEMVGISAILALAYGVSRTRYYRLSAIICVVIFAVPVLWIVHVEANPDPTSIVSDFAWLIIPMLLAGLTFSFRFVVMAVGISLAWVFVAPFLIPELLFADTVEILGLVSIAASLVVLAAGIRQRDLDQIEAQLSALNDLNETLEQRVSERTAQLEALNIDLRNEIAARREVETQLRQNRDELHAIVHNFPGAIGSFDRDLRLQHVDGAVLSQTGLQPETMRHKTPVDIFPPEITKKVESALRSALQGENQALEIPLDDRKLVLDVHSLQDSDGNISRGIFTALDITELRRAQTAVAASEDKFRTLFEFAPDSIVIADESGRIMLVNAKTEALTGYRRQELVGQPVEALLPKHLHSAHVAHRADYLAAPAPRSMGEGMGLVMQHKNGSEIPVEVSLSAVNAHDEILVMAFVVDITERKQAREQLEAQRNFLRQVIDLNPGFIFAKDEDGRYTLVNKALADSAGVTPEEMVGKRDTDFSPVPKEAQNYYADDLEVIHTRQPKFIPEEPGTSIVTGLTRWYQTIKVPLISEDGKAVQVLGISTDITQIKQAQDQLEEQRNFLRQIIDLDSSFVFVKDEAGRFTLANKAIAAALGVTPEAMIGKTDADLGVHDEENEFFRAIDLEVIRTRQPSFIPEESVTNPETNETRWYQTTKVPLISEDGKTTQVLGVSADITSRKRAEQALSKSEEKYRTLFETMAQGVVYQNSEGAITAANPAAERILGLTLDQMRGRTTFDPRWRTIREDGSDFPGDTHPITVALRTGEKVQNVVMGVFNPLEEAYRWISISATPQFWPGEATPYQVYATFTDITELRNAQEALAAERNLLRTLFDSMPMRAYVKDRESRFLLANQEVLRQFDFGTVDDILGKSDFDLFSSEEAARWRDEEIRIIQTGQPLLHDEKEVIRNDRKYWFSVTKVPLRNDDGDIIGIVGVSHDITERKQTDEALRESEARYRLLVNNLPQMGVIMFDHDMDCVMDGPLIEHQLEHLTEIIDTTMLQLLPGPGDAPRFRYQAILAGEEVLTEHRINGANYEAIARPVRQPDGTISAGMLTVQDVTERKQAERELRLLLTLTDQIAGAPDFDAALQIVLTLMCTNTDWVLGEAWIPHPDGEVLQWRSAYTPNPENSALQRFVETSKNYVFAPGEGTPGRVWVSREAEWHTDSPSLKVDALPRLHQARDANLNAALGLPIVVDGTILAVLVFYMSASRSSEERTIKLASAVASQLGSVLRQKQLQDELERYGQALARSNEELQQFAYVASHDLQEPLRVIVSYLQLLERRYKGQLGEDADKYITRAVGASGRMKTLIEDLLQYSRVNTRGEKFEMVDMALILENVLANLETAIEESGAVIYHDPMPVIVADGRQIAQVLQNLIANAVKFRGEEGPEIHVRVQEQNGEWTFSVRDNGIGIEPQYYERIFTIFQRLHSRKHYEGTGIGLAICRKIVERHGGKMWVESEPGQGSTFYFTLPDQG